uniref:TRIM5-1 alpha isoform n=1 Tax=Tupaia belangeri TaxID=37347 RepID=A0A077B6X9_TUPBE|nr:TRIM5-1 alpha isoform [Tupaia belangeri]
MALAILMNIKEEVTCPICLELLTKPQSLDCGHSFCQSCITANQTKSTVGQEGECFCPVCRVSYRLGSLRPNHYLANIVEKLREANLSPEEKQEVHHCARHGEKLLLFCKEDGKAICLLCERSQEHRGHQTFLIEEAEQEYQEKLQATLKDLMEKQQEVEKWKADIHEEKTSWKNLIQCDRQSAQAEFKILREMLDSEEQKVLQKLEKEERNILLGLEESENELAQQSQSMRGLISDLEYRLKGSKMEMLQDVNDSIKRCETVTLKKPNTFPKEQRRVSPSSSLMLILKEYKELTDVQRYWVHVTMTPINNANILISNDRRQVRYQSSFWIAKVSHSEDNCPYNGILGVPGITSGKHYWEVDVSNKRAWILGVCLKTCVSFFRKPNLVQCASYLPKNGYWVIGLQDRSESKDFKGSLFCDPLLLTPSLTVPLCRIGVFVDYEAGTVSFFNATNHGFLIYKFSAFSFSQEIFPYFNPMRCEFPMTLCSPFS